MNSGAPKHNSETSARNEAAHRQAARRSATGVQIEALAVTSGARLTARTARARIHVKILARIHAAAPIRHKAMRHAANLIAMTAVTTAAPMAARHPARYAIRWRRRLRQPHRARTTAASACPSS